MTGPGVYAGAEVGYRWGRQRFNDTFNAGALTPFDTGTTSSGIVVDCSIFCETVSSNSRVFVPNLSVPLAAVNQKGWVAGGFFGAQKQWGRFAPGLEADIDGANINGAANAATGSELALDAAILSNFAIASSGCPNCNNLITSPYPGGAPNATVTQTARIDSKTDELGTLRGKVGFAPARELLMYGTGGLAWAHTVTTLTGTQTVTGTVVAAVPGAPFPGQAFTQILGTVPFSTTSSFSAQSTQTLLRWSAGGGTDWKLTPNIILGALYLHYEFPPHTLAFGSSTLAAANLANTRLSVDVVKARASYLFPIH
jgi:opacity protein-like surface antigen